MFDMEITSNEKLTDTARLILHKDKQYRYKKIYIDTTGMGWGVYDILKEDKQTKRKVIAIENVKKSLDKVQSNIKFRRLEDGVGDWVDDLIGDKLKGLSKNKNITFK